MTDYVSNIVPVFMLILGLSYLIQARMWEQIAREFIETGSRNMIPALVMVVAGLTIIINHNIWIASWTVAITIFGWILLIKGITILLFPQMGKGFTGLSESVLITWIRLAGVIFTLLGAILTYTIWFAG